MHATSAATRSNGRSRTTQPRVVVVTRPTEYDHLLQRHGTRQQAEFFLRTRGQGIDPVFARHVALEAALHEVANAIPNAWRRARVDRADLDRFLFEPDDIVVAVGQDGLVANTAKYLDGQCVIGVNPDPSAYEGVLVPHPPAATADLVRTAVAGRARFEERAMVSAVLANGRELVALNEVFIGHRTHQSARYEIRYQEDSELHSSSGLIVATGTGATGWARSIAQSRHTELTLPMPTDPELVFFVREAWPSIATGTDITQGVLTRDRRLAITSRMEESGVIFGDGIESDRIEFGWGQRVELGIANRRLRLMQG